MTTGERILLWLMVFLWIGFGCYKYTQYHIEQYQEQEWNVIGKENG